MSALPPEKFIRAIELTQLVSIDLVLLDPQLRVLVGKRKNDPAKDLWFVPGSRVFKNEPWKESVKRISKDELGFELDYSQSTLIGIFDHNYPNNFLNELDENGEMIDTHYVCIALQISIDPATMKIDERVFADQHSDIQWMAIDQLVAHPDVHQFTKNYFIKKDD